MCYRISFIRVFNLSQEEAVGSDEVIDAVGCGEGAVEMRR